MFLLGLEILDGLGSHHCLHFASDSTYKLMGLLIYKEPLRGSDHLLHFFGSMHDKVQWKLLLHVTLLKLNTLRVFTLSEHPKSLKSCPPHQLAVSVPWSFLWPVSAPHPFLGPQEWENGLSKANRR